jgi:hypothetical protein
MLAGRGNEENRLLIHAFHYWMPDATRVFFGNNAIIIAFNGKGKGASRGDMVSRL